MNTLGSGFGRTAMAVTLAVLLAGCTAASRTEPSATMAATPTPVPISTPLVSGLATSAARSAAPTPAGLGGRLVVLADGADGKRGLWVLGSDTRWTGLAETPAATGGMATEWRWRPVPA